MIDWRRLFQRIGIFFALREPPNLPPYGWAYFDHIVALYVALNTDDPRANSIIGKSRARPDALTWGDVFLLENIIFNLQPPDILIRNAWITRERFREIVSSTVYEKYIASGVPKETDTPAKVALLRADLCRVLAVLHWYYSLIPIRERKRKSLTIDCILMVVFYTVLLGVTIYWCHLHSSSFFSMVACVLYLGIIGGFVSSQRRMQNIPTDGDPLISLFGLDSAGYYLWLSPLLGAVFAILTSLMFVGGMIKGTIFPDFITPSGTHPYTFFSFAWQSLPKTGTDYAKLFVWSFLAGFAERLVPDNLDRLANRFQVGRASVGPPPPTVPEEILFPDDTAKPAIRTDVIDNVMHTGEVPAPSGEQEEPLKGPLQGAAHPSE